jgi:hypothetical protein
MIYKFEIKRDEYAGLIVIEYFYEKPNCVWELDFVKKRIHINKEDGASHSKHSITRCINWLMNNHSELLL